MGLQILEQLTIPIDCRHDLEVEKTKVTVALSVTGDWLPIIAKDKKWKKTYKKMVEVRSLSSVRHDIHNFHLLASPHI